MLIILLIKSFVKRFSMLFKKFFKYFFRSEIGIRRKAGRVFDVVSIRLFSFYRRGFLDYGFAFARNDIVFVWFAGEEYPCHALTADILATS